MKRDEKYVKVRHRVVVFECKDVLFELATVKSGSLESMRERGGVEHGERESTMEEEEERSKSVERGLLSLSLFLDHLSF
jgi:hypothetical protein